MTNSQAMRLIRTGGLKEFVGNKWVVKKDPYEIMDNGLLPRRFKIGKRLFAQVVR